MTIISEIFGSDTRATTAVLDCIACHGVHNVNIDVVAKQLYRSRSNMYRQFGSWRGLLAHAHAQVLDALDTYLGSCASDRRQTFDAWWAEMSETLRSANGQGFRALRGLVAETGCEDLAIIEVQRLRSLRLWIDPESVAADETAVAAHQAWTLLLAAAAYPEGSAAVEAFRELTWKVLSAAVRPAPFEKAVH